MNPIFNKTLSVTLLLATLGTSSLHSLAQTSSASTVQSAQNPQASALVPAVAPIGDTIDERARRAAALEDAKLRAEQEKAAPKPSMALNPVIRVAPVKVAVPRAELYVEAIRGYPGSLEAVVVINGKFTTASMTHPSLADGWTLTSINQDGVTVTGGKERRSLAFVGPEPYMPAKTSGASSSASAFTPSVGAGIPQGRPIAMPIGVMGR